MSVLPFWSVVPYVSVSMKKNLFNIMDYQAIVDNYNQQIKALGERYTFSNDMCEFMRSKLQSVSGFSSKTFFDVASSFCKFYQDSIETTKQISLITQERDDIIEMMKRNGK